MTKATPSSIQEREQKILSLYEGGKSLRQISEEVKLSLGAVYRVVKKAGIVRDKSESQALAIANGTRPHPTAGKKRSEETKEKISKNRSKSWENVSDEERQAISERQRKFMQSVPEEERKKWNKKATAALHRAKTEGSKIERFVRDGLIARGYKVEFHRTHLVTSEQLEMDLYLPDYKLAIEIDGPWHYCDNWGQERLESGLSRDEKKNGLLVSNGFNILRVMTKLKSVSQKYMRDVLDEVVKRIEEFKGQTGKFISTRIEVTDDDIADAAAQRARRRQRSKTDKAGGNVAGNSSGQASDGTGTGSGNAQVP
jgi:very-short-patch-repair endonuclease/transposase